MNKEQAEELLLALGSEASSESDEWVRGPCPLAAWLHPKKKDSKPSFGIYTAHGEPGRFHCFTCESGSLATLLQTIEFHQSQNPVFKGDIHKAREIVENEEIELPILQPYSEFVHTEKKGFVEFPQGFLDQWPHVMQSPRAMAYLEHRKFGIADALKFDLRYDQSADRIIFPYRDVFGRLAGLRGRGIAFPGEQHYSPHHDYPWEVEKDVFVNNASMVFLNEQVLDEPGPVLVVEGQFDVMRVSRVFPRVLGNLTAKPMLAKTKKLAQAEGVVLMLDGDDTGRKGTQRFVKLLDEMGVPVMVAFLPLPEDETNPFPGKKTDPDMLGEAWIEEKLKEIGLLS